MEKENRKISGQKIMKIMKYLNMFIFSAFVVTGMFMYINGQFQMAINIVVLGCLYIIFNKLDYDVL